MPPLYATAAAALTLTGPSTYSWDALAGLLPLWTPMLKLAAIAIGIVGGGMNLAPRARRLQTFLAGRLRRDGREYRVAA